MSVQAFLGYCQLQDGKAYVWGGRADKIWVSPEIGLQTHGFGEDVFDCAGLPLCAIRAAGGPDWRATHNANTLWNTLEPLEKPEPGALVFYGMRDHAAHVEVCMTGGKFFGALNGSRHTTSPDASKARVRYRLTARPDLIGFRRNPLA